MDYDFLDGCAAAGLELEEVVAEGWPLPPDVAGTYESGVVVGISVGTCWGHMGGHMG